MPLCASRFESSSDKSKCVSSDAAARKVEPLSESNILGRDLRPANLRNACRKHSTVRLVTISKWMAQDTAHVNKNK